MYTFHRLQSIDHPHWKHFRVTGFTE